MATVNVSSNSQLLSALRSTSSGDVIHLASGHYSLSLNRFSKAVTITSAGSAVFDHLELVKSSHLKIDGVDFNAPNGVEKPFIVRLSSDITIRNGDMEGVASGYGEGKGIWVNQTSGFTFENMRPPRLQHGRLPGRDRRSHLPQQYALRDQMGRDDGRRDSSWPVRGKHISLHRPERAQAHRRHAVLQYRLEQPAERRDDPGQRHRDPQQRQPRHLHGQCGRQLRRRRVDLLPQPAHRGQYRGQRPGQRHRRRADQRPDGARQYHPAGHPLPLYQGNQHSGHPGPRGIRPGVSITGNTTHRLPEPSGNNWFPTDKPEPTWTIANNKIVPLGTTPHTQAAPAQLMSSALDPSAKADADIVSAGRKRQRAGLRSPCRMARTRHRLPRPAPSGGGQRNDAPRSRAALGGGHMLQLGLAHDCIA